MVLRTNNFEGSTNGTTLTQGSGGNTGGGSGDYFDIINLGSGAGLIFDNTRAAHGTYSLKVTTGATAALSFAEWSSQLGGTPSTLWFRIYAYFTANPSASRAIARFLTSGAVQCSRLVVTTAGKLQFNDAANTSQIVTTNSIPLNQWFRIEGFVTGSPTAGQLEIKLFSTKDSATPTETQTSGTSLNTTDVIGLAQFGQTGFGQANITEWMDDIAVSDTAYVGPVPGVTGTGSVSLHKMGTSGFGFTPDEGSGSITLPKMSVQGTGAISITLFNNFEGGSNGTAIHTSDTGSGTPWDSLGGSTTLPVYSSAAAMNGLLGASTPLAANSTTTVEWKDSFDGGFNAANVPWYTRDYFKISSYPPVMVFLMKAQDDTIPKDIWAVSVNSTGHLGIRNRVLGTNPATAATAIPLNTKCRWEARCKFDGNVYSVQLSCFYGANADGATADEILTANISSTAVVNVVAYGAQATSAQTWSTVYHDNIVLSTNGPIGPVNPNGTGSIALRKMSLTGSGTTHVVLGTGSIAISKMTLSGTSTEKISGDGTVAIPKMTMSGTGVGSVTLTNNFEGGQESFAIHIGDTGSGSPFDDLGGSFTLPVYTAAGAISGMGLTTPLNNNSTTSVQWRESFVLGFNDQSNPWYGRDYFKITSLPPATVYFVQFQDDVTPQDMFGIAINTSGHILLRNRITATTLATSAATVSLNTRNRVEFSVSYDGATYSITVDCYYDTNADGTTPDETLTGSVSSALFVNVVGFGAQAAAKQIWSTIYHDNVALTTVAPVGPTLPEGTGNVDLNKMTLSGTGTRGTPTGNYGDGGVIFKSLTFQGSGSVGTAVSKTFIGANGGADGLFGQSAAQFQAEVTKYGVPLRLVKVFFNTKLGDTAGGIWQGTNIDQMVRANPGLVAIICWNTIMTQDEIDTFCNSIPANQLVVFSWQNEVEIANPPLTPEDYQAGWADQALKIRAQNNPHFLLGNSAAGYTYTPTGPANVPNVGQFMPPEDLCDVYMIDTYQHEKGGSQFGVSTWPIDGLATTNWSYHNWASLVPAGKKKAIAEYGIDNCLEGTNPGKRVKRLQRDISWVLSQTDLWGFCYWDHTMSTTDCSKGWKLTTTTEIGIYSAFAEASGVVSFATIQGQGSIGLKKMTTAGFGTVGNDVVPSTRRVSQPSAFWYTYDSEFRRSQVIEGYKSFIWTERYSAYGDFQIVIPSTAANRKLLATNTWIGKTGSNRVMKVLTVSDDTADDGTRMLTVTGKSIETVFEDRVGMPGLSDTTTSPNWILTGTPMDIAYQMFQTICVVTVLDPHDSIDYYVPGEITPAGNLPVPSDIITVTASPDTLYNTLKSLCDSYNLGFRLVRAGKGDQPAEIHFEVYVGNDLTLQQSLYPAVIFDPAMENLSQISQLTSTETVKNVAYVFAANGYAVVYAPDANRGATGLQRRVLLINSNNDLEAGPDLDAALQQEGLAALAQQKKIYSFDGQLPPTTKYVYGVDYNLGDLVEERASDGFGNTMLVIEQIFVSDDQGDRAYPTLSVFQAIVPDSWQNEGSITWSTINPAIEWSDA